MDKQKLENWLLYIGLIICLPAICIYVVLPQDSLYHDSYLELLSFHVDHSDLKLIVALVIISFVLILNAILFKIFKVMNSEALGEYELTKKSFSVEEKYNLAELSYIIQKIESLLESDSKNSWHWEIKLKCAAFMRSKLLNGEEISCPELSKEDKSRLDKESSFLTLKDYDQETQTDLATRQTIKSKMALYAQHRQELL